MSKSTENISKKLEEKNDKLYQMVADRDIKIKRIENENFHLRKEVVRLKYELIMNALEKSNI
jgi:hypothetical protein